MEESDLPIKQGFRPRLAASYRPTAAIWCHRSFSGRRGLEGWFRRSGAACVLPGLKGDVFLRMTGLWISPPPALSLPSRTRTALQVLRSGLAFR
jgi:hypothetical protein